MLLYDIVLLVLAPKKRMRIWSLHPRYLDVKGLTVCWCEALLARKVLLSLTHGYRNHPQLIRFRSSEEPIAAIKVYLIYLLEEAKLRGYHYDESKVNQQVVSL